MQILTALLTAVGLVGTIISIISWFTSYKGTNKRRYSILATVIAAIVFLTFLFAFLSPTGGSGSGGNPFLAAGSPQIGTTITLISTPTPTPTPTPIPTPTPTPIPAPTSPPNKPLTCQSRALCSSYSMNIVISKVEEGLSNSTWDFQIMNNGTQAIDAYVKAYIDFDEFRVYVGEVHLNPNAMQPLSVTFPAYAPVDGTSQEIKLEFQISSSLIDYAQTCTYSTSQKTCQSA